MIFGATGALGAPTIEAFNSVLFKDKINAPVRVFSRKVDESKNTDAVKYVAGDILADSEGVIAAISGADVIISLLAGTPELTLAIEKVVLEVKPKLYIPSQFGADLSRVENIFPGIMATKSEHCDRLRKQGVNVVEIYTSYFVGGPWLYEINGHVGIDTTNKSVTYLGSADQDFSYTHLSDVGRAIAVVATSDPAQFPAVLKIQSGKSTPAEITKLWETRHNTKLEVKGVIPRDQVLTEAKEDWRTNGFDFKKFFYYLNVLLAAGKEGGLLFLEDNNELINPDETLWKWSKF